MIVGLDIILATSSGACLLGEVDTTWLDVPGVADHPEFELETVPLRIAS